MDQEFVTMQQVSTVVSDLIYKMSQDAFIPDTVIAISKGGIIPATMLSYHFGVELVLAEKNGYIPITSDIGNKVLIVDDIVDTGSTITSVIEELEHEWGFNDDELDNVYVASMFVTRGCDIVDYYHSEISSHDSIVIEFKVPS